MNYEWCAKTIHAHTFDVHSKHRERLLIYCLLKLEQPNEPMLRLLTDWHCSPTRRKVTGAVLCMCDNCVIFTRAGNSDRNVSVRLSVRLSGARQHLTNLNSAWKPIFLYSHITHSLVSVELSRTTFPLSVRRPCNVYWHVTAPYKLSFIIIIIIIIICHAPVLLLCQNEES